MPPPRPYAGIGSRQTPPEILRLMQRFASRLAHGGWELRSGGGRGADRAFQQGAGMVSEIYLPEAVTGMNVGYKYVADADWRGAGQIAIEMHPQWNELDNVARCHHTRTVCILLGRHLDHPARFMMCWTPDGASTAGEWGPMTGGTGFAIALASSCGVPVFNLRRKEHLERVCAYGTPQHHPVIDPMH